MIDLSIPVPPPAGADYSREASDRLAEDTYRALVALRDALAALPELRSGRGAPEGAVSASVGALYLRQDGAAGSTLYVKESGTGPTGWVAK